MRNGREPAGPASAIVIGGSAGGLIAAAMLRRGGWRADVFEKSAFELVGRGAGIAPTRNSPRRWTNAAPAVMSLACR
jgi:2-polyprenyl-6-methoxyphenol hydroxylase-like FAD-dependent oxidoreductase